MKKSTLFLCISTLSLPMLSAYASNAPALHSPTHGVLCDRHMCADEKGISRELTAKYLGEKTAAKLFSQGDFDLTAFTYSNGVFCDTKERLCRANRYFGTDGKRSGKALPSYTGILFGK
ncbi:MAG TPA: YcgJ family protein [Dyella sp.]|uniref:YcgJ family protein n=1 Tax=Dyella sp. TaxID=1869338 RepID=UPI002F93AE14